jgi:enterochelin esterase family protein
MTLGANMAATQESWLSPRLSALRQALAHGNLEALGTFWQEIEGRGTPLIEPITDDDEHVWVTFLWRGNEQVKNVTVIGQLGSGSDFMENQMAQLPGTDLWYKTYILPSDLRAAYCLSPNDTLIPYHEVEDWEERTRTWQPDPLNPHRLEVPEHRNALSTIELPDAPVQPWIRPRAHVPAGKVEEHSVRSAILGNQRTVWVYLPPGYTDNAEPYRLLLLFDGGAYLNVIHVPTTLDNLLADGLVPPLVAVFLDIIDFGVRARELACHPPFADFLAQELVPWLREHYPVTMEPEHNTVGGFSLGGLAAAYVGLRYPELFGRVLAQSGAFWWCPEGDREHEWLARKVASTEKLALKFYLDVGLLETDRTAGNGPSLLVANRHLRTVLQAKGYPVHYAEYAGGHDYLYWRGSLADSLIAIVAQ